MSATPEDGLSYEEACAAAGEEHLGRFPPLDGGKKCPLRTTICLLAEAESLGTALDEKLQGVKEHTGVCSACQHTYGRASSFYVARATSEECSGPEVVGGVDFERSPVRALRNAATTLTKDMVAGMTPRQVFAVVCATAGLETEKGVEALGLGLCPDWLDDYKIMRDNLLLLGVPEEILPAE
jgi:hypothetical protein